MSLFLNRDNLKLENLKSSTGKEKTSTTTLENLLFGNLIEREWLATEDAAHFLSITPNALRIMVHRDQIKAYKFGRRLRFKLEDCRSLFSMKGA